MAPGFVIRSLDPGHTLEPDGEMITHACYDALVTFNGADLSTPRPHLATDWKVSAGGLCTRSRSDGRSGSRAVIR